MLTAMITIDVANSNPDTVVLGNDLKSLHRTSRFERSKESWSEGGKQPDQPNLEAEPSTFNGYLFLTVVTLIPSCKGLMDENSI